MTKPEWLATELALSLERAVTLSGHENEDAKSYQEKQVKKAIEAVT